MAKNKVLLLFLLALFGCNQNKQKGSLAQGSAAINPSCNLNEEAEACQDSEDCLQFCKRFYPEDLAEEAFCQTWPITFFDRFKPLFKVINSSLGELNVEDLSCFIDLSKDNKTLFTKFMHKGQATYFLQRIAIKKDLAKMLAEKEDRNFPILKELFKKAHEESFTLASFSKDFHFIDKNFIHLVDKYSNHEAWKWMDQVMSDSCSRDRNCRHPLKVYCQVLNSLPFVELDHLVQESQFLEDRFKSFIQAQTCRNKKSCVYGDLLDFDLVCDELEKQGPITEARGPFIYPIQTL